ncbi:hypothetical protein ACHQM5_023248 [Ranunculus cassubicifolius]
MARHSSNWWISFQKRRWLLTLLLFFSISTAIVFVIKAAFDQVHPTAQIGNSLEPLQFMNSKLVLLVSHELSLSGGPLLLMELAFLLRSVGAQVVWITNQKMTYTVQGRI